MRRLLFLILVAALPGAFPLAAQTAKKDQPAKKSPPAEKTQPAPTAAPKPAREPGLYMRFETDLGSVTCKLYEKETPITVGKIVGLATGRLSYTDPRTRQKVSGKRFYDGLTFHRVIPNFMIQGGDPLGTGMGGPEGPGFPFQDEFVPSLRFDVPGRLAMANAGPRTNASQFFITDATPQHLNNVHTIFGQCENIDVVKAIARVPTRSEQPIKPVLMKRVVVERVGPVPPNPPEGAPTPRPPTKKTTTPKKTTPAPKKN